MSPTSPTPAAIAAQLIAGYLTRKRGTVLDGEQIGDIAAIIDRAASAWQGMDAPQLGETKHLGGLKAKQAHNLSPEEFIRFLSHRKGWHGNMYRSHCSRWVAERMNQPLPSAPTPNQP